MADWPTFEVGIYGFGDCYIEAPTKASARWCAASKCHEAGYGTSPVELIQRECAIIIDRQETELHAGAGCE